MGVCTSRRAAGPTQLERLASVRDMPAALRWLLWRDTRVMVLRETGAVAFSLTFGQRPAFAKVPMELASTELFLGWATFRITDCP